MIQIDYKRDQYGPGVVEGVPEIQLKYEKKKHKRKEPQSETIRCLKRAVIFSKIGGP